jgi:hypothetical protein
LHPNLGPDKIHPLLETFCGENSLKCPKIRTITRIVSDDPEKMRIFPQKISCFGKIKKANRQKIPRKPKSLTPEYPGHLIALDTIEKHINGNRRYVSLLKISIPDSALPGLPGLMLPKPLKSSLECA